MADKPNFGQRGRMLWDDLHAEYDDFTAENRHRLIEACRLLDEIEELHVDVKLEGKWALGSRGTPVIHPAYRLLMNAREMYLKLAKELDLPAEGDC